jgi:hypothetical protein
MQRCCLGLQGLVSHSGNCNRSARLPRAPWDVSKRAQSWRKR